MSDNVKKRKSWRRILLGLGLALLFVLAVGPFLIPVPPLTGTVPPQMLADDNCRFITANGLSVHYQSWGDGVPDMLLRGFGASTFTWREVGKPLAAIATPWAFDRPAFGLTERPLFSLPQFDQLGPLLVRTLQEQGDSLARLSWHDPDVISAEIREGYRRPLQADNWDVALWELTKVSRELNLADQLDQLPSDLPILLITGDDDRVVPTADTIRLAEALPQATLVVIPNCGHVPQEECPAAFVEAVEKMFNIGWADLAR